MWIAGVRERLARQYVTIDQMPPPDYAKLKEPTTSSPTIIKSRGGVRKYMFREMGQRRVKKRRNRKKKPNTGNELKK